MSWKRTGLVGLLAFIAVAGVFFFIAGYAQSWEEKDLVLSAEILFRAKCSLGVGALAMVVMATLIK
jgi:hypothetical protein